MKKYEITEEQRQEILNVLAEAPAKYTFNLIAFFNQLKPVEEPKQDEVQ